MQVQPIPPEPIWAHISKMISSVSLIVMLVALAVSIYKLRRGRDRELRRGERVCLTLTAASCFVGLIVQTCRDMLHYAGINAMAQFATDYAWPIADSFSTALFGVAGLAWILATDAGRRQRAWRNRGPMAASLLLLCLMAAVGV